MRLLNGGEMYFLNEHTEKKEEKEKTLEDYIRTGESGEW